MITTKCTNCDWEKTITDSEALKANPKDRPHYCPKCGSETEEMN